MGADTSKETEWPRKSTSKARVRIDLSAIQSSRLRHRERVSRRHKSFLPSQPSFRSHPFCPEPPIPPRPGHQPRRPPLGPATLYRASERLGKREKNER